MIWKKASVVFQGGTQEATRLLGKRFRVSGSMTGVPTYDIRRPNNIGVTIDLPKGTLGYIGQVASDALDKITLAVPQGGALPPSLDKLARSGSFHVVRVNWPTFRANFEIEV